MRLYAPAIVLLVLAGLTALVGDSVTFTVLRLVALAGSLGVSINEQRRLARIRRRRRDGRG